MDWSLSDVDVVAAIEDGVRALKGLVTEKEIELYLDIPPVLPTVQADRDQLIQVIINLVSNAIKFCDPYEGKIWLKVRDEGKELVVTVEDNGLGVPAPLKEKIFERFHQSAFIGGNKPQGSGLGLAISRQIVTFFGGRIWAENMSAGGARFVFTLPVEADGTSSLAGE